MLMSDPEGFANLYKNGTTLKKHNKTNVTFKNRYGIDQTESDWFKFEYEIWYRMHSNEPKCFAGDHLRTE